MVERYRLTKQIINELARDLDYFRDKHLVFSDKGCGAAIGNDLFAELDGDRVVIGGQHVRLSGDCSHMFYDMFLESIDFTGVESSKITDLSFMFRGCNRLKSISGSFDTSYCKDFTGMFSCCRQLEELDVSWLNFDSVESMSMMFTGCSKLEYLDVSNFNVTGVKDLSAMFQACTSLKDVDISKWDVSKCENIISFIEGCKCIKDFPMNKFEDCDLHLVEDFFFGSGCSNSWDVEETLRNLHLSKTSRLGKYVVRSLR